MMIHYFDENMAYNELSFPGDSEALPPSNGTFAALPPSHPTPGYWPVFNPAGNAWVMVEDHRGEVGYVDGQHVVIAFPGPLPDGWSVLPPEQQVTPPTTGQRVAEIDQELVNLDIAWIRATRAKNEERLDEIEQRINQLNSEREELIGEEVTD